MKPQADALAALRDIQLPGDPSWWPPAPGWWLLALLLLALTAGVGRALWRRYRLRLRLRRVLARLDALVDGYTPSQACEFVTALSALLRRVALSHYPREQVAPLTGEAWLRFLDEHGGRGGFRQGAGRVLADGAYRRECEVDVPALAGLARAWIEAQGALR